jgi:hypothetical protein
MVKDGFEISALLVSCAAFSLGPYFVWPNRWNIVGHTQLGLFVVQYFIPVLFTDSFGYARRNTVRLYTEIMVLGACIYLLTLSIGFLSPRFSLTDNRILAMPGDRYRSLFSRRVITVMVLSTLGLFIGFAIMGFVPIFAADPMQAKYFHGEYHAGYLRAEIIFRPSYIAFISFLPLAFVVAANERKLRYYLLILAGVAAIIGCLNRGELGVALVGGVGIIVVAKRGKIAVTTYVLSAVVLIAIGTLGNYLLNVYFALNTGKFGSEGEISETIAQGAPDVIEGVQFLDNFEETEHFTYGAQFIGGFIPLQSWTVNWIPLARYNPGFWAQGVLLGTQNQEFVRNIGGGGVRIAVPISGYAAFGWFGVVFISGVFGCLTGYLVRFARNHAGRGSLEQSAIVIAMYIAMAPMVLNPSALTLQAPVPPLMLAWMIYPIRVRTERSIAAPNY